jgi:hypothetical protein
VEAVDMRSLRHLSEYEWSDILEECKVDNEVDTGRDRKNIEREWAKTVGLRWRRVINMNTDSGRVCCDILKTDRLVPF